MPKNPMRDGAIIERNPLTKAHWVVLLTFGVLIYLLIILLTDYTVKYLHEFHGIPALSLLLSGVMNCGLIVVGIFLLLKPFYLKLSDIGLKSEHVKFDILLGIIVGISWPSLILFVLLPSMGITEADISAGGFIIGDNVLTLVAAIAAGWLIGGIVEELIFRGHLITTFGELIDNKALKFLLTTGISILLFALIHSFQGILGVWDLLGFALIMCLLFQWRKSLISPIIAHGLTDMIIFLGLFLYF